MKLMSMRLLYKYLLLDFANFSPKTKMMIVIMENIKMIANVKRMCCFNTGEINRHATNTKLIPTV